MGRRILNRKDLRADYDAAERRKEDETPAEEEEEEDDDDEGDDAEEESDEEEGADDEEGSDDEDEEEKKPKKKKPKPVKAPPKPRTRTPKIVRMRVVWGVFSNNHQCLATYDYPKKKDAEQHAARLATEKRSTFFVQPVKEPIEEKKEK